LHDPEEAKTERITEGEGHLALGGECCGGLLGSSRKASRSGEHSLGKKGKMGMDEREKLEWLLSEGMKGQKSWAGGEGYQTPGNS